MNPRQDPLEALVYLSRHTYGEPAFHERLMFASELYGAGARHVVVILRGETIVGFNVKLPCSSCDVSAIEAVLNKAVRKWNWKVTQKHEIVTIAWSHLVGRASGRATARVSGRVPARGHASGRARVLRDYEMEGPLGHGPGLALGASSGIKVGFFGPGGDLIDSKVARSEREAKQIEIAYSRDHEGDGAFAMRMR